jgi:transmembrane sensor
VRRKGNELKILDFALDRSFIHWVRSKDPESEQFWTDWLMNHPEMDEKMDTARSLLIALQFRGERISSQQINTEWEKLYGNICSGPTSHGVSRVHYFSWKGFLSIVAALLFLMMLTLIARWLVNEFITNDQQGFNIRTGMPCKNCPSISWIMQR